MSPDFVKIVRRCFNPYTPRSGTESVGPLLYALARMGRYETAVEFGAGFTTPFIALALAENHRDYVEHRATLAVRVRGIQDGIARQIKVAKTLWDRRGDLRGLDLKGVLCHLLRPFSAVLTDVDVGPIAANPLFYLRGYDPQLFVWDAHPADHPYIRTLAATIDELGLSTMVTVMGGAKIAGYLTSIPRERLPIGMAWNDFGNKIEFFEETYDSVGHNGIFAFHSPRVFARETAIIRRRLRASVRAGRCELMNLSEPHKLVQDGCFLIRKCEPVTDDPLALAIQALEALLALR